MSCGKYGGGGIILKAIGEQKRVTWFHFFLGGGGGGQEFHFGRVLNCLTIEIISIPFTGSFRNLVVCHLESKDVFSLWGEGQAWEKVWWVGGAGHAAKMMSLHSMLLGEHSHHSRVQTCGALQR